MNLLTQASLSDRASRAHPWLRARSSYFVRLLLLRRPLLVLLVTRSGLAIVVGVGIAVVALLSISVRVAIGVGIGVGVIVRVSTSLRTASSSRSTGRDTSVALS